MKQYKTLFGDYPLDPAKRFFTPYAVRGFLSNGGTIAYMVRVGTAQTAFLNLNDRASSGSNPTLVVTAKRDGFIGNSIQAEGGEAPAPDPPKQRRKKTRDSVVEAAEVGVQAPSSMKEEEASESSPVSDAVSPTKPKRTRRVGEPKPKRYAVGEKTAEPNVG